MSLTKEQREEIIKFILWNVRSHPSDIVRLTQDKFKLSRPAVLRYIHRLIAENKISVEGSTRNRKYALKPFHHFERIYQITDQLAEDAVWRKDIAPLLKGVKDNVIQICQYGFTEIFNNAIDHSEGKVVQVEVLVWIDRIDIDISDNGVGIFNKIQKKCNLDDPIHAILELAKGKLTTEPQSHTGEGIFFTSRMFDFFAIISGQLVFGHRGGLDILNEDNLGDDDDRGTSVIMQISPLSERTTNSVFSKFTTSDFGFNKTIVPVKLARYGNENLISRSQAKRLLTRLDRFKTVVLEFDDVPQIGRAFADEIFRVFANAHPGTRIIPMYHNKMIDNLIKEIKSKK